MLTLRSIEFQDFHQSRFGWYWPDSYCCQLLECWLSDWFPMVCKFMHCSVNYFMLDKKYCFLAVTRKYCPFWNDNLMFIKSFIQVLSLIYTAPSELPRYINLSLLVMCLVCLSWVMNINVKIFMLHELVTASRYTGLLTRKIDDRLTRDAKILSGRSL